MARPIIHILIPYLLIVIIEVNYMISVESSNPDIPQPLFSYPDVCSKFDVFDLHIRLYANSNVVPGTTSCTYSESTRVLVYFAFILSSFSMFPLFCCGLPVMCLFLTTVLLFLIGIMMMCLELIFSDSCEVLLKDPTCSEFGVSCTCSSSAYWVTFMLCGVCVGLSGYIFQKVKEFKANGTLLIPLQPNNVV